MAAQPYLRRGLETVESEIFVDFRLTRFEPAVIIAFNRKTYNLSDLHHAAFLYDRSRFTVAHAALVQSLRPILWGQCLNAVTVPKTLRFILRL